MPGMLQPPPPAGGLADAIISGGEIQPQALKSPAIGIDLGTSFSSVAVWKDGEVHLVPIDNGKISMPSFVAFTAMGRFIGDTALNQSEANPESTLYNVKRLTGRRWSDICVQSDLQLWPGNNVSTIGGDKPILVVTYSGQRRVFCVEEVSAMIIMKLRKSAGTYLGCDIKDTVITVPTSFGISQRLATKTACLVAGMNVLQILNETTATAITYVKTLKAVDTPHPIGSQVALNKKSSVGDVLSIPLWKFTQKSAEAVKPDKYVLIFDLGGGGLNVSVILPEAGIWKVKAATGDTHLGGEDFDNRMVCHYATEYHKKYNKDISKDARALRRLKGACERSKCAVSSQKDTVMSLESFSGNTDYHILFSSALFEYINKELFEKCKSIVSACIREANIPQVSVSEIVLVGGSSKIPKIRSILKKLCTQAKFCDNINLESVAYGAAIQAAAILNRDTLPVVDITTTALGVTVNNGSYRVEIPRYSNLPAHVTRQMMSTLHDNQSSISFTVHEGDNYDDSCIIGKYHLCGIPEAPKGVPEILLQLDIDTSGVLNMSAEIEITGKKTNGLITCDNASLTKDEIQNMKLVVQQCMIEDEDFRNRANAKDGLMRFTEVILSQEMSDIKKEAISTVVELVRDWARKAAGLEVSEYEKKRRAVEYIINPTPEVDPNYNNINCSLEVDAIVELVRDWAKKAARLEVSEYEKKRRAIEYIINPTPEVDPNINSSLEVELPVKEKVIKDDRWFASSRHTKILLLSVCVIIFLLLIIGVRYLA